MTTIAESTRITLKNVLYLTDFSEPSEAALPFAVAVASDYGARVHALHVLTPVIPEGCSEAIHADEELANAEMAKVDSRLTGVAHDTAMARGVGVWPALEQAIHERNIDLIVLGTHGRTHAQKLLLGSFAEEILRRSSVPVLTIGPHVRKNITTNGTFHSVLFATDFSKPCEAAAPFAVSLAEENDARLILLYVAPKPGTNEQGELAIADVMQRLGDIVPSDARKWCHPSPIVQYGDAADRILEVAIERGADLIVLGVRDAAGHLGAATHLERAIAHKVVAHAQCPVLTVRG
ncbi:MAG: universal stress protein [Candidatus Acidiferrales bacterium]|jgi:nucleotide-binding universal stress UspA family protein